MCPTTRLRLVPLPIACGDREDREEERRASATPQPTSARARSGRTAPSAGRNPRARGRPAGRRASASGSATAPAASPARAGPAAPRSGRACGPAARSPAATSAAAGRARGRAVARCAISRLQKAATGSPFAVSTYSGRSGWPWPGLRAIQPASWSWPRLSLSMLRDRPSRASITAKREPASSPRCAISGASQRPWVSRRRSASSIMPLASTAEKYMRYKNRTKGIRPI